VGFGAAAPPQVSPFSGWLWRLCRHNQPEIKDIGWSATFQTSCREGERVSPETESP